LELLIPDLFNLIFKKNMELFAMTDSNGGNVFHLAAHLNHAWVFEFLRPETEYLTRARDLNGDLPLPIASKMGHVEHIEKLRKVSLLLNVQGQTVLHIAAKIWESLCSEIHTQQSRSRDAVKCTR